MNEYMDKNNSKNWLISLDISSFGRCIGYQEMKLTITLLDKGTGADWFGLVWFI